MHIGNEKSTPFPKARWLAAPKTLAPNLFILAKHKKRSAIQNCSLHLAAPPPPPPLAATAICHLHLCNLPPPRGASALLPAASSPSPLEPPAEATSTGCGVAEIRHEVGPVSDSPPSFAGKLDPVLSRPVPRDLSNQIRMLLAEIDG
jgi:hypothetical protein